MAHGALASSRFSPRPNRCWPLAWLICMRVFSQLLCNAYVDAHGLSATIAIVQSRERETKLFLASPRIQKAERSQAALTRASANKRCIFHCAFLSALPYQRRTFYVSPSSQYLACIPASLKPLVKACRLISRCVSSALSELEQRFTIPWESEEDRPETQR